MTAYHLAFAYLALAGILAGAHLAETLRMPASPGLKVGAALVFALAFTPLLHLWLTDASQAVATFFIFLSWGVLQAVISVARGFQACRIPS